MPRLLDIPGYGTIDADEFLLDCERAANEESLYKFLQNAWPHMDPAPWRGGWAVQAIAEHLEAVCAGEITRLIINVPPRTSKSSLCSVAFPAWTWAQRKTSPTSGPQVRFLYASYGETLSLDHSTYCRQLIKTPWYQRLWADRYSLNTDQDSKHAFANTKGGQRIITSIDSRITGRGGQIIIIDDPNATNEDESETKIEGVKKWWDRTMSSRLNDRETGAFILIQQRVAEDDLTGHILEKNVAGWDHLMLPMRYEVDRSFSTSIGWKDPRTAEGELLWPERFSPAVVTEMEAEMGPYAFAGQYQQRPEPAGGGVIKRDWWQLWESDTFPLCDYILASLDTAYTEKTENDYSALTVWGVYTLNTTAVPTRVVGLDGKPIDYDRIYSSQTPRVVLMAAWRERLPLHELVQKVADTCKHTKGGLKVDKLLIENKGPGISVAQEIRRLYGNEAFAVQLQDPKSTDKLSRLYSVQHLFAEGMVSAPDRAWADMVITEVGVFPKGRHDDLVDTVSQALRHLRDLGLLQRGPERTAEVETSQVFTGTNPTVLYPGM